MPLPIRPTPHTLGSSGTAQLLATALLASTNDSNSKAVNKMLKEVSRSSSPNSSNSSSMGINLSTHQGHNDDQSIRSAGASPSGFYSSRFTPDSIIPTHFLEQRIRTLSEPSSPSSAPESPHPDSRSSLSPIPGLQDHEILKLAEATLNLARSLPPSIAEPRFTKKKCCADYEVRKV